MNMKQYGSAGSGREEIEVMIKKPHKETAEQIKHIILRATEIPKGARNPTRDATVILGEKLCDLIDYYVEHGQLLVTEPSHTQ